MTNERNVPSTRAGPRQNLCCIAELCCVLDFAGKPALPSLLGRGVNLAGTSGYWVGHSSGSFAVGLLSVREPSLRARLPRIFSNSSMTHESVYLARIFACWAEVMKHGVIPLGTGDCAVDGAARLARSRGDAEPLRCD